MLEQLRTEAGRAERTPLRVDEPEHRFQYRSHVACDGNQLPPKAAPNLLDHRRERHEQRCR